MHDARECHDRAEALATLALMFPEHADRYREKERGWRDLETRALATCEIAAPLLEGGDRPNAGLSDRRTGSP